MRDGFFSEYIASLEYTAKWELLTPDSSDKSPEPRGGHQMCCDSLHGYVYLYGGWDGAKDLGDLWRYSVIDRKWVELSSDTKGQGGPGPRSCHKMCINETSQKMYVLGKYVDVQGEQDNYADGDFYTYDIATSIWTRLSNDTTAEGGPGLIFDHQMCMDEMHNTIYVFGGRTVKQGCVWLGFRVFFVFKKLTNKPLSPSCPLFHYRYSGMYLYDCAEGSWSLLRTDQSVGSDNVRLSSRIGHSMLLNDRDRHLYIFAGQRKADYMSDFYRSPAIDFFLRRWYFV